MKDAYSFDLDIGGRAAFSYNKMFTAYLRTFARLGLTAIPMVADTGPIGGDLSHEFIILASTGESEVYLPQATIFSSSRRPPRTSISTSVAAMQGGGRTSGRRDMPRRPKSTTPPPSTAINEASRISARGIEVGHIFYFGTKYSAADEGGRQRPRR